MRIEIIPLGILFTFDISNRQGSDRVILYKRLYGYNDFSHGKYKYKRKGILSDMKHLKPTKSTIITTLHDAKTLRKFFRQNKVKFSENVVMLHESQARKLKVVSPNKWVNVYKELLGKDDTIMGVDW